MEERAVPDKLGGFMAASFGRILRAQKGQSLIELSLIVPLMVLLAYGAIEVGSVISTYLTLTHTTREAANLASRGGGLQVDSGGENYTTPNDILDTVIKAAAPTLSATNKAQWRVVYSKVIRSPNACNPGDPCEYIVDTNAGGRFVRGNLNKQSKLGPQDGTPIPSTVLPGIQNIKDSQTFHVFEIFYDYAPNIITFVGNGINTDFYDRTMFTDVSGT
jgi:Flp pilus assembly protein TadG